jgi:two-component system, chemotaxis family, sensor kinase CheA
MDPAGNDIATVQPNALAADPELLGEFIVEAREHLSAIEFQALAIEQDPSNRDAIHAIFRAFHTIKGLAGFLSQRHAGRRP